MSYNQKVNSVSDNIHKQYEFKKQTILADESLTENEKSEEIKAITITYDGVKVALNEGVKRICENCNQECLATLYCEHCVRNYLKANFSNWTSGNDNIDNLIQECQMKTFGPNNVIEWIPYYKLQNIKYLKKGVYTESDWIDGRYDEWDSKNRQLKRYGSCKVMLKRLENVKSASQSWFEEVVVNNVWNDAVQYHGLTQDPLNGNYMLVMKQCSDADPLKRSDINIISNKINELNQFENLIEPKKSTEVEEQAFNSNDSYITETDSTFKDMQIDSKKETMRQQIRKYDDALSQDEINILLLGETGVGKTTFINAFANYLKFKTFNDAKSGDIEILVSSKFTITDGYYNNKIIKIGIEDSNEQFENVSTSSTQRCRSHVFHITRNKKIRLIDTPGIGDTRGLDQDKKNFADMLNYISNYKFLNGICILLKPNNSRLNVVFRFYIQELLTNLHKNAKDNIVFCFTNSRGTFYRPGDTLPPLKEQLEEFNKRSNVELKANKDTMYCFDNESFRFLAAFKRDIKFINEYSFAESWDKSVDESLRLIKYIMTRPPHKVKHTLSLNNSRNIVSLLSKPLAEIEQLIQMNIKLIKEKQKELEDINQEEFKDKLYILQLKLEPVVLEYPRTVCTNNKCIKLLQIEQTNIRKISYTTHCCLRCHLTNIRCDEIDNTALRSCSALVTGECKICGCSWNKHMHITYENNINIKVKKKSTKKAILEKCHKRILKLQKEQQKINEINLKFTQFLRQNAIYNSCDAYVDYLNHFINEEKIKKCANTDNDEIISGLETTKKNYLESIEVMIKNNDSSMHPISPKDIAEFEQQLYSLKINGSTLKKMKDEAERSQTNAFIYNENHYIHTWKSFSNFITKVFQG
ncbi:hypothetical protein RclHR1_04230012 [Rhizophagus clarus]|uniref:DUF8206 domain-containing protein n=1 Tax=Rhizophagus clarus TaxID=94130 RepID=A0A2Z6SA55_9GLOM|nr:hypothetical protein RclHR1_04230012 [Rhizophagus clarus]